jgi:putative cardiolipin synthase
MCNFKVLSMLGLTLFSASAFAETPFPKVTRMSGAGNSIEVINHGVAALQKRFEMIDRAQSRIDVEYFIYNADEAGRLMAQALMKKQDAMKAAGKPFEINIILDASSTVLKMNKYYIRAFQDHGINVKYYNTTDIMGDLKPAAWHDGRWFGNFKDAQFRDHRKLLSVDAIDGQESITGSRNIADEYFDLSKSYNFRDRDIFVKGPMAKKMDETFTRYWNASEITKVAEAAADPVMPEPLYRGVFTGKLRYDIKDLKAFRKGTAKLLKARAFFVQTAEDVKYLASIKEVGDRVLAAGVDAGSTGECANLVFATDVPGLQSEKTRGVTPELFGRMKKMVRGELLSIESPYFIVKKGEGQNLLSFLNENGVEGELLTNSLASTDAFYVAASFNTNVKEYYKLFKDAKMYSYAGRHPVDTDEFVTVDGKQVVENAVFGIHSKTFVFGKNDFAVGTYNVDPRSASLNSEMVLFCEGNATIANFIRTDMNNRISRTDRDGKKQSDLVMPNGLLEGDIDPKAGNSFIKRVEYDISTKVSNWDFASSLL